jgi:hypothetical protein
MRWLMSKTAIRTASTITLGPSARPSRRWAGLILRCGGMVLIAGGLATGPAGCTTGSPPPEVTQAQYNGPPISLEESAGQWLAMVRPDSPGWRITLDRRAEGYGFEGFYVTIQEPNPAFSYPLVPVEQRLALHVEARRPVKVFARLVSFDGQCASGEAYVPTPAAATRR